MSVGSFSTFDQEVVLEIGSIFADVGSSLTLNGHLSGLSAIDATSHGNVNLIEDSVELVGGELINGHKGLNVYVQEIAEQQQVMKAMPGVVIHPQLFAKDRCDRNQDQSEQADDASLRPPGGGEGVEQQQGIRIINQ